MADFKGPAFYDKLVKWIMSENKLRNNGFPRKHPDGPEGRAMVYVKKSNSKNKTISPNRICDRCGKRYAVDEQGVALQQETCMFHWGRMFRDSYSCCNRNEYATGCSEAKGHVWEYIDYGNLYGYVETLPKDGPVNEQGVYALDCEMCYTTQGLELVKVTIIDEDCKVAYETLVKSQNPVIDYYTRFSGVTEEDMKDVTTTISDVQAKILTMFSNKTILVGHSLENHFQALKLLHDTVVDTSLLFPHRNGRQKRALKTLCSEYLGKDLQRDDGGYDSKKNVLKKIACMELVHWKVKK